MFHSLSLGYDCKIIILPKLGNCKVIISTVGLAVNITNVGRYRADNGLLEMYQFVEHIFQDGALRIETNFEKYIVSNNHYGVSKMYQGWQTF